MLSHLRALGSTLLFLTFIVQPSTAVLGQQVTAQDLDKVLEKADKLLDESKTAYEDARSKNSVPAFVDAGFKLEEARIKYIVLQEIGSPEKQKIATDRLRAVNQLGKLIHDGKVAITGASVRPSEEKPAADPGTPAPERPPVVPIIKAADVTKRFAPPEPAKLKDAEKAVKDLFKDLYSKKSLQDRKSLVRALLEQAASTQDDPAGLWVLLREAQDIAASVCDVRTSVEVVDSIARVFDVDALAVKSNALSIAGKAAKAPEEFASVAQAFLLFTDELVAADQYEAAEKAAAAAAQHARSSRDAALTARATTRLKEVSEAKAAFLAMKGVLETLAKTPDDPAANWEMGKFLCFVKGNWELGIRFFAKGSDEAFKALSTKELSFPTEVQDRIAVADGWFDLGEREKSPLRKNQLQSHARTLYEAALVDATGLSKARISKRLEDLDVKGPVGATIDLLRLMSSKDSVGTEWTMSGQNLVSPNAKGARIQIPYVPGESEYDLTVAVQPKGGTGNFEIGLAYGSVQFMVDLDGSPTSSLSGLHLVDGKVSHDNETTHRGKVLVARPTCTIVCAVRRKSVTVTVDGKKIIDYKGEYSRLSMDSLFQVPNPQALFLAGWASQSVVTKLTLTKVSGQGKILR